MKKFLFVLHGESFRYGGQFSRVRGKGDYYDRQLFATSSHIKLIDKLANEYDIDILINSYELNRTDDDKLYKLYKNKTNNFILNLNKNIFRIEEDLLNNTYDKIKNIININDYEYIFISRIDMFLKNYMIDNFNKYLLKYKIVFPHIDSNFNINKPNTYGVFHTHMIIPKNYFDIINNNTIYNMAHGVIHPLINKYGFNCVDYMVYTLHVCCTDLGWNPLYICVGKNYNTNYSKTDSCCSTIDHYYDIENHIFVKDIDKTINYWNSNKDNIEFNFQKV
jgi:hypothetical protein